MGHLTTPMNGIVQPMPDLFRSMEGAANSVPQSGHFSFLPLPIRASKTTARTTIAMGVSAVRSGESATAGVEQGRYYGLLRRDAFDAKDFLLNADAENTLPEPHSPCVTPELGTVQPHRVGPGWLASLRSRPSRLIGQ